MVLFISLKNIVHNNPYYHATIVGRGPQNTDLYAHYQQASFVVDSLHNLSEHNVGIDAQNAVQNALSKLINVHGFEYIGSNIDVHYYDDVFKSIQDKINAIADQTEQKMREIQDYEMADSTGTNFDASESFSSENSSIKLKNLSYTSTTTSNSLFMNKDNKFAYSQHGYYDQNHNWIQGGWDQLYQDDLQKGVSEDSNWKKKIDESGCSMATSAMVLSNLKYQEITPNQLKPLYTSDDANNGGRFADEVFGSYQLDYSMTKGFSSKDNAGNLILDNVLENGGAVIRSVTLYPESTDDQSQIDWNGHYVALLDVNTFGDKKMYYFADSNEQTPGKWITEDSLEYQWMAESHGTTIMIAPDGMTIEEAFKPSNYESQNI